MTTKTKQEIPNEIIEKIEKKITQEIKAYDKDRNYPVIETIESIFQEALSLKDEEYLELEKMCDFFQDKVHKERAETSQKVQELKEKILTDWKGQNEFVDWLDKIFDEAKPFDLTTNCGKLPDEARSGK